MAEIKRRKLNMKENELEEREIWSDLPKDLLLLILSLLTLKESTCASAVCKNWFLIVMSVRVFNKSPLLMMIPNSDDVFGLYNPSTRKTFYLDLPQLRGCWIYDSINIDGWLLISQPSTQRVFFFNLHTQVSIELPSFDFCGHKVAFSSSPVSHDCMVWAVKTSKSTVAVSKCNLRTMKWTTCFFTSPESTLSNNWVKIIFSNGFLYCKSVSGWVWIFNTQTFSWTFDGVPPPRLPRLRGVNRWKVYMTEHKEQIFLFYLCGDKGPIIFKLDQTNKKWEKVRNLGGVIFFLSMSSAQARVYLSGMKENNIYFPKVRFFGHQCIRYSVDEARYYPNKKYSLPQDKPLMSIWIDPPGHQQTMHPSVY